jgi:hypothetical protein
VKERFFEKIFNSLSFFIFKRLHPAHNTDDDADLKKALIESIHTKSDESELLGEMVTNLHRQLSKLPVEAVNFEEEIQFSMLRFKKILAQNKQ